MKMDKWYETPYSKYGQPYRNKEPALNTHSWALKHLQMSLLFVFYNSSFLNSLYLFASS